jgi:hypothetical protein
MIVKINKVKFNTDNPRIIKDFKFKKLVKSIKEFPEMLEKRPIVVDENMIVLGGNMRLKACHEAGFDTVHILKADNWSEEQKKEFIIKDNVGFGEWDWDILANSFDTTELTDWGVDVINHDWGDLDYINDDIDKPNLNSHNTIVVTIPDELIDERNKIEEEIKTLLSNNFSGCEIK